MNILVTVNANYLKPLRIMLKSLFLNNPNEAFHIFLLHAGLKSVELADLDDFIRYHAGALTALAVDDRRLRDAPISFHYTREMYFRLLAFRLLPRELDRILYLDPDILILNPIRTLYRTDISGYLYAAAYHDKRTIREINKIRLYPYGIEAYFNSGVLLMNLDRLRKEASEDEIYRFIRENRAKLVMPDQDILNSLYSRQIRKLDERYYNYDARYYYRYKLVSGGRFDMDRIVNTTVVLHFCGKKKPWNKNYSGVFLALYKHYEKQADAVPRPHPAVEAAAELWGAEKNFT